MWAHGAVDVTGAWNGFVCYFWYGEHEQEPAHEPVDVSVPAGKTVRFHFPNIRPEPPDHCRVQIDVATSCAKSSIIPGLLADGHVDLSCPQPTPTPTPTPTPPPCQDVFWYKIRNREAVTTTYTFSNGHQTRLRPGAVGGLGPTHLRSVSVAWRDASWKRRTHEFTAEQCGGDFVKACHSEFWVKCDCVF